MSPTSQRPHIIIHQPAPEGKPEGTGRVDVPDVPSSSPRAREKRENVCKSPLLRRAVQRRRLTKQGRDQWIPQGPKPRVARWSGGNRCWASLAGLEGASDQVLPPAGELICVALRCFQCIKCLVPAKCTERRAETTMKRYMLNVHCMMILGIAACLDLPGIAWLKR